MPPCLYHNSASHRSERCQSVHCRSEPRWACCWSGWCLRFHLEASLRAEHWRAGREGLAGSPPGGWGTVAVVGRAFLQPSSPSPWDQPWRAGSMPEPSSWGPGNLLVRATRAPAGHQSDHNRLKTGAAGCPKPGRGGGEWKAECFHPDGFRLDPAAVAWKCDDCRTDRQSQLDSGTNRGAPRSPEAEAESCINRQ